MRKDYDQLDRDYNKLRDEHNELERKYYELKRGLNDVDHAEKGASEKKRVRADETAYTPQPQNLYLPQYSVRVTTLAIESLSPAASMYMPALSPPRSSHTLFI